MVGYFDRLNKEGIEVQEIVKSHLTQRHIKVVDVSQVKDYQRHDIDFILFKGDKSTTLEVKKDKSLFRTGNIFVECGSQRGIYYSAGWVKYCEADYICYYDTVAARGIIVDRLELLSLLDKGTKIQYQDKFDDRLMTAILLPLDIAKKAGIIKYEWRTQ